MSFNGNRLRMARVFRGLNQRQLAEGASVSPSAIAFFEKGVKSPKDEVRDALAVVLKVDQDFFSRPDFEEYREETANFRRRIAASDRQRKQVLAHASLFADLARYLQREVSIPAFSLPEFVPASIDDVDLIADKVRSHFGIPVDVPIGSVTRLLERAGVLLLSVDLETAERIDALSCYGTTSVVVLNTEKDSPSRTLFEAAHEMGHGVMHRSNRFLTLDQREAEANRFAGALLLPRAAFTTEMLAVRDGDWAQLFEIKRHWGASIKAILYRAYQLQLMDAAEYRKRMKFYSYRGWNRGEPEEPQRETPTLFARMFKTYLDSTKQSTQDVARALGWSPDMFNSVTGMPAVTAPPTGVVSLSDYRSRSSVA